MEKSLKGIILKGRPVGFVNSALRAEQQKTIKETNMLKGAHTHRHTGCLRVLSAEAEMSEKKSFQTYQSSWQVV